MEAVRNLHLSPCVARKCTICPVVFEQRYGDYGPTATGLLTDQVEYRLGVTERGGHRLQHIDGRGLMGDPFAGSTWSSSRRRVSLDPQRGDFGSKIGDRSVSSRGHVPPPTGSGRAVAVGQFMGRLCAARPFSKANDGCLPAAGDRRLRRGGAGVRRSVAGMPV